MSRGGARNRSGPPPDPMSGRSDRRGLKLTALPSEGYAGEVPSFPLPRPKARELELWRWAWSTPQACAWAREAWRWQAVAMWVRTSAICESAKATAADKNALHRFADQIGLTPAGLKENGWAIAADQLAEKRADVPDEPADDVRGRLAVVPHAAGG
ncbi:hypothetical protein OOK41_09125 [Micromonospora sp. NBC_01655]|uniref:hypothetical protein n=1 Tax=Micromonospora sp. NBC_01655 TaxID=2975983 RepID=UPI0022558E29|nr:hypothetical protein [Micromonospora sp. NBC_01655]MCX4470467.1 hypothetical protein [Micromonospora sp. NBC_01655]